MKTILLASALLIGGTAYAQADPSQAGQPIGSGATLQPGTTMGERDTMGAPTTDTTPQMDTTTPQMNTMPPANTMDSTTTGSTMGTMDSTTGSTMGTTGSGAIVMQQGGNMTPPPEPRAEYPRCSRTITDNCVQDRPR